ncbi:hypothetical protein [Oceanobacter mangrovi]|uniref:hypothetical protein n=1 Tax=Oceanobacter mangrovi TaxID=2862510 RepID=UPI001C8D13F5|nr:hypothetical protein [Oceanobacter mangrovi]
MLDINGNQLTPDAVAIFEAALYPDNYDASFTVASLFWGFTPDSDSLVHTDLSRGESYFVAVKNTSLDYSAIQRVSIGDENIFRTGYVTLPLDCTMTDGVMTSCSSLDSKYVGGSYQIAVQADSRMADTSWDYLGNDDSYLSGQPEQTSLLLFKLDSTPVEDADSGESVFEEGENGMTATFAYDDPSCTYNYVSDPVQITETTTLTALNISYIGYGINGTFVADSSCTWTTTTTTTTASVSTVSSTTGTGSDTAAN